MTAYFSFDIWIPAIIVGIFVTILAQSQDRQNLGCTSGLIGFMVAVGITGLYRLIASQLDGRVFWLFTLIAFIIELVIIGWFATFAVREGKRTIAKGEGAGIGMIAGAWTGLGTGVILSPISFFYLPLCVVLGLALGTLFGAAANRRRFA